MSLQLPVQYPVKVYRHDDMGAPQLSNANGTLKTILKACLVTGYGDKQGAGWTMRFEDDVRMVLRCPAGHLNVPDIKIENGVVNGQARHRVVSQNNPDTLDDASAIASVLMLAKQYGSYGRGNEWYVVACDFGFVFCYQIGYGAYYPSRINHMMYVGALSKIMTNQDEAFVATYVAGVEATGTSDSMLSTLLYRNHSVGCVNLKNNSTVTANTYLWLSMNIDEKAHGYLAQRVLVNTHGAFPFFISLSSRYSDMQTETITLQERPMLRYVHAHHREYGANAVYIPTDYWEL